MSALARGVLLLVALFAASGCATYADRTRAARASLDAGDYAASEKQLNELLEVESSAELPQTFGSETALTLLERGMVQHAQTHYRKSARDLSAAEKELELLDIASDDVGAIGAYVYSDDASNYRAPPTEKLMLNAFNMANYLAEGDLAGAKVEARRFTVMRKYLTDYLPGAAAGPFGAYLAGFVHEQLGEVDSALRYYDEALAEQPLSSLREPVARLFARGAYRTERLEKLAAGVEPRTSTDEGELLVVLATGRVPVKEAKRIPIGAALGLASNYVSGDTRVLEYGMFKVLTYPELVATPSIVEGGTLAIDGGASNLELVDEIDRGIFEEYEAIKPKLIGAALTRMIVRAAAAEGARAAGNGGALGFLAAAVVEGTLVALDKPDTRSWGTLPAKVYVARQRVPAGKHRVRVIAASRLGPIPIEREVEVPAGGFATVFVTTLR